MTADTEVDIMRSVDVDDPPARLPGPYERDRPKWKNSQPVKVHFPEARIQAMMTPKRPRANRRKPEEVSPIPQPVTDTEQPKTRERVSPEEIEYLSECGEVKAVEQKVAALTEEEREEWDWALELSKSLKTADREWDRYKTLPVNEQLFVVSERHERIARILKLTGGCIEESPGDAWSLLGELCMAFIEWDHKYGVLEGPKP